MAPTDGKPIEKSVADDGVVENRSAAMPKSEVPDDRAYDDRATPEDHVYFVPGEALSEAKARTILAGDSAERLRLIENILQYALWDDIWSYVERQQVEEVFARLDLPTGVGQAWARWLKLEAQD